MAGTGINVTLDDAQVQGLIQRIEARTNDFSPLLNVMGDRMSKFSIPRNFREGGRPEKWKPSKRAAAKDGQTLINTGRLRSSITYAIGDRELRVGTNVVYARIHQLGGRIAGDFNVKAHERTIRMAFGRTIAPRQVEVRAHSRHVDFTMPARPFLLVQDEDFAYFRREIGAYLTEVGG
jgi:phage gpG-like protein